MSHIGIELRISTPDGPVVQATSDVLHLQAKYGGGAADDSWHELLTLVAGHPEVRIETRAVELPDDYPDEEDL